MRRSLCKYSLPAIATPKIDHRSDRSINLNHYTRDHPVQIIIKAIALQAELAKQQAEALLKKYRDRFGDIGE